MPSQPGENLRQRKQPVQARSGVTVAALFEASIQVLLAVGYRKMTTARIAERAGVSVGTLYQYFPNRQALIAAVIENYLREISDSVARDCAPLRGRSLDEISAGLVDALVDAKWRRIAVARAIHEPLADTGGAVLVRAAADQGAGLVAALLESCSDARFDEPHATGLFVVAACSSLLQAAIGDHAGAIDAAELRRNMRAMVRGYLLEMRRVDCGDRSEAAGSREIAQS